MTPPEETQLAAREDEQLYCYGHPDTPTRLRCSRCDRPICGRCAIPASVGQHCPECVAEARRSAPKVRTALQANAPAVYTVIVVTIISFVLQQVIGFEYMQRLWFEPFAISNGEWWRLVTPVLLHDGFLHIAFNMYILYIYGQDVEQIYGTARFVFIYVATAVTASALSYAVPPDNVSVGASGAVFGIAGALIVYLYNRRTSTFANHHLRGMMGFLAINAAIGFIIPRIDWLAHLGGLIGGILLGLAFDEGGGSEARSNPVRQIALVLATAVLTFVLLASR